MEKRLQILVCLLQHCHHYDFHFRSQILYSSDELKARQCRHPDIRYQDSGVFAVTVKVSISSSTMIMFYGNSYETYFSNILLMLILEPFNPSIYSKMSLADVGLINLCYLFEHYP
jgi:hypothetical protein